MIMSIMSLVTFYIISSFIGFIIFEINIFSIGVLSQIILLSFVFEIFYSIINCYAMWCASLTYTKVIQFISMMLYMGSVFTIFAIPSNFNLYSSMGTWIVMSLLGIYATICYFRINKEKAMNTLAI